MAGWWILFAESSPVFCFSDLHLGEPKGSHWKVIASPFDRCWHKSFLFVCTSSLWLSFPPLNVKLGARGKENCPGSGMSEAPSLKNIKEVYSHWGLYRVMNMALAKQGKLMKVAHLCVWVWVYTEPALYMSFVTSSKPGGGRPVSTWASPISSRQGQAQDQGIPWGLGYCCEYQVVSIEHLQDAEKMHTLCIYHFSE